MERLTGQIQPYAWGSTTAIPELLGTEPTGERRDEQERTPGTGHPDPPRVGRFSLSERDQRPDQHVDRDREDPRGQRGAQCHSPPGGRAFPRSRRWGRLLREVGGHSRQISVRLRGPDEAGALVELGQSDAPLRVGHLQSGDDPVPVGVRGPDAGVRFSHVAALLASRHNNNTVTTRLAPVPDTRSPRPPATVDGHGHVRTRRSR